MVADDNKVVAHFLGGRLAKGYTFDFNQNRNSFHVVDSPETAEEEGSLIYHDELKALFFVKSFEGNASYEDPIYPEDEIKNLVGMKLKVIFKDGEVMYATTYGYSPARRGFFVFPVDKGCNNEKVYVVTSSTSSVEVIR